MKGDEDHCETFVQGKGRLCERGGDVCDTPIKVKGSLCMGTIVIHLYSGKVDYVGGDICDAHIKVKAKGSLCKRGWGPF